MPTSQKKSTKSRAQVSSAPLAARVQTLSALAREVALVPLMTEKTAHLSALSVYVFRVANGANRIAVRQAFREMYGVLPIRVNIIRTHGKEKRFGRTVSRRADTKKAYVTVPAGTTLDLFATA